MSPGHKLTQLYGTLPFLEKQKLFDASFVLASRILLWNVAGHQTKSHFPQELSTSSNTQHNLLPPTFDPVAAEYACFITMSRLQDVPFQIASLNIFAASVLMIRMPLIRVTKL